MQLHLSLSLALLLGAAATLGAAEKITALRTGEELIVEITRLDRLRLTHSKLTASLQLHQPAGDKHLLIDLTDPALHGALVIDLTASGRCDGLTVTVKTGSGEIIARQTITPIPEVPLAESITTSAPGAPAITPQLAYIESGSAMRRSQLSPSATTVDTQLVPPRILLPAASQMRQLKLASPTRLVSKPEITFPVLAAVDLPLVGGSVLGRQTDFPNDTSRTSLYFACKKAIYAGSRVERWQKFLVEIPIQSNWGQGRGDESVTLSPIQFAVHVTNEKSPSGANMLGTGDNDLGQTGDLDTDEQGRIYWRGAGAGAYVVRFDPHTRKFEQPPGRIDFQKLVPPGAGMLNDGLCRVSCTRGRVFFTLCNDTRSGGDPANPLNRRLGGVFSIPQDWSNAATFANDIRLHVGSWETARPALYRTPPKADTDVRKLGGVNVTATGLFITTAGPKYEGGPWRLELDDQGNTRFLAEVNSLTDTIARDGRTLTPTQLVMVHGIPKGRELSPGPGGGRNLIRFSLGEITIPRTSIRLLLHDRTEGLTLKIARKGAFPTYDGAPEGTVTVRYDLVGKLKSTPAAQGPLADSLSGGTSIGPAFLLSPVPGVTNQVVAVCEYAGYPLSILDFSSLGTTKTVGKTFLPPQSPAGAGLGPYNSTWVQSADEQWLYLSGYTGLSRIRYARDGKVLPIITADLFNSRLQQQPLDGHGRTSMKKIDGLLPVFGGRLLNSGYGLDGRGGDAFSTGVELFDPHSLGPGATNQIKSQTSAYLSRCFALKTLHSRLVWNARDGHPRQEIFAASGSIRRGLINELKDPSVGPANLDGKVFLYEVIEPAGLRDLYGFSLPKLDHDKAIDGHLVLSPCNRFLVVMTQDGVLYSYSLARKQFIDGVVLHQPDGGNLRLMEFKRPSQIIFTAPDGQIFFLAEPFTDTAGAITFHRVEVSAGGRLSIVPHLGLTFENPTGYHDFKGIVRCFLPDRQHNDGSYDFVLGYSQQTVQPYVRVIRDFLPPQAE